MIGSRDRAFLLQDLPVSLDFCAKYFYQDFRDSDKLVIFTYNLKTKDYASSNE